jgi:hypothetical protein
MAWIDQIKENVFDARFIGRNLIDWFKANQVDALAWASSEKVKPIDNKQFHLSPNIFTVFPVFNIDDISTFLEVGDGDIDQVTLELSYSVAIKDGDTERMARHIPIYELAFSSMARNIPKISIEKDSKIEFGNGSLTGLATDFRVLENERGGVFINTFRTTISWEIDFER